MKQLTIDYALYEKELRAAEDLGFKDGLKAARKALGHLRDGDTYDNYAENECLEDDPALNEFCKKLWQK